MTSISYVSADTSVASVGSGVTSGTDNASDISDEQQVFLSILLTQLENQNPLDPVDTTEFTNQLVAYSSLEQEMTMNENLESIISSLASQTALSSISYIGADVELDTTASIMQGDEAEWAYVLEEDAKNITLQVTDSEGNILSSYSVEDGAAGTYSMMVANSDLTEAVDEGTTLYLGVIATDSEGENIRTDVLAIVTVDGIETTSDEITLSAGSLTFTSAEILSLRQSNSS
ncbi:MAG: hypothetical protein KAJ40_08655 [Alphaproteobacteria bacterium]|nr:hypothetical protein [Alphaproteobacteria bacterium]